MQKCLAAMTGTMMTTATPSDPAGTDAVSPTGKFRIYLGSAAGVGKTVAMLDEGHRRHDRGADVVVGFAETHQRAYTAEKLSGLEVVPRKQITYRGALFEEMDLDAVIRRKPEVALVDELAHTNVPGSGTHSKRWQDVQELLQHGIKVITTLNIQHLESLADSVEAMTGIKVQERVPDRFVRFADQIELVDSSPEALRRRLVHGNIYPQPKVSQALGNFFKTENLTALRDLALRFVADETEEEMLSYLATIGSTGVWETRERIMVAVTGAQGANFIIHRAARIAARTKGELYAVHVRADDSSTRTESEDLSRLRAIAEDLGAKWEEIPGDRVASALVQFAKTQRITQIVLGSTAKGRWKTMFAPSMLQSVIADAGAEGIDVHVIARREAYPSPKAWASLPEES